jgi:hypothetical protein
MKLAVSDARLFLRVNRMGAFDYVAEIREDAEGKSGIRAGSCATTDSPDHSVCCVKRQAVR